MSSRITSSPGTKGTTEINVEETRARETKPLSRGEFRHILLRGASVLMSGAVAATTVVGGPILAAAVHGTLAGTAKSRLTLAGSAAGVEGAPGGVPPGGGGDSDMATMHAMQRESQAFNLQLLHLQEEVQQENRHFTTVSNVLRAKHDTAKAAVSNIRA
jgi:hypothetical protein